MIAFNLGDTGGIPSTPENDAWIAAHSQLLFSGPFTMHNAEITWRSPDTFSMFDDCMSIPDLFARVERHDSISVAFDDEGGARHHVERVPRALAELVQHECDHLDGVLMTDRASELVYRSELERDPEYFNQFVDYQITAT